MAKDCKICGGSEKKFVVVPNKWTGKNKTVVKECICVQSRIVSEDKDYPILSWLGDTYLPPAKYDPDLIFNSYDLANSPNYIFYNPDYYDFCLHMKSIIMRNRFKKEKPLMRCCTSISVLQDFYVKAKDNAAQRQLSDVNDFALLIMTMDNKEKNEQLKTVMAQVVYSRLRLRRPTWLYVPSPTLTADNWEYSEELMKYLNEKESNGGNEFKDRFIKKKLIPVAGVYVDKKQSQSQQTAAGFGRK